MTITLTPQQKEAIQQAIQSGLVGSVEEFIETAIESLPHRESEFHAEKARSAVARIREIRKGVKLDLKGMSIREFAHIGHKH